MVPCESFHGPETSGPRPLLSVTLLSLLDRAGGGAGAALELVGNEES